MGLTVVQNDGKGDCTFHAIAQAFKATSRRQDDARAVRVAIVANMVKNAENFANMFGGVDGQGQQSSWKNYNNMKKDRVWGKSRRNA